MYNYAPFLKFKQNEIQAEIEAATAALRRSFSSGMWRTGFSTEFPPAVGVAISKVKKYIANIN